MARGTDRFARLLRLLWIIQSNPRLGVRGLRDELERADFPCSERTVYRELRALQAGGVPIYYDRGYKIQEGFFLRPVQFTLTEALALVVAIRAVSDYEGMPQRQAAAGGLTKLLAALPSQVRANLAGTELPVRLDPLPVSRPEHRETFDLLMQATTERRRVRMRYFSLSGQSEDDRLVDPYALVFRERAPYLIAYCHRRRGVRTFRVDRVRRLEVLSESFAMPPDFSAAAYLRDSWEIELGSEVRTVVIRFQPSVAPLVRESRYHETQQLTEEPDGSVTMTVETSSRDELARWVVGFGGKADLIAPPDLRQRVAELARGALAMHQPTSAAGGAAMGEP